MSINVPSTFSKEDFKKLINKKLNTDSFQQYKKLFTENYKCPRGAEEYSFKEGLSYELLTKLDYILKRIEDKKQFDSINDIAEYFDCCLKTRNTLFYLPITAQVRLGFLWSLNLWSSSLLKRQA